MSDGVGYKRRCETFITFVEGELKEHMNGRRMVRSDLGAVVDVYQKSCMRRAPRLKDFYEDVLDCFGDSVAFLAEAYDLTKFEHDFKFKSWLSNEKIEYFADILRMAMVGAVGFGAQEDEAGLEEKLQIMSNVIIEKTGFMSKGEKTWPSDYVLFLKTMFFVNNDFFEEKGGSLRSNVVNGVQIEKTLLAQIARLSLIYNMRKHFCGMSSADALLDVYANYQSGRYKGTVDGIAFHMFAGCVVLSEKIDESIPIARVILGKYDLAKKRISYYFADQKFRQYKYEKVVSIEKDMCLSTKREIIGDAVLGC